MRTVIEAVVFDLDGVLVDSEPLWDAARRAVTARHRGRWTESATRAMQGMSSREWAAFLHDSLGVDAPVSVIVDEVVEQLVSDLTERVPLLPGAVEAVRSIAARWPTGLASSANRRVIERVLSLAGLEDVFSASVSSDEVERGKPAPDVYLAAADLLEAAPTACVAVEDSENGICSALGAGMMVVAVRNDHSPPRADVLERAMLLISSPMELSVNGLERAALTLERERRLDEEEEESFPASDPHSDWAGPPA